MVTSHAYLSPSSPKRVASISVGKGQASSIWITVVAGDRIDPAVSTEKR